VEVRVSVGVAGKRVDDGDARGVIVVVGEGVGGGDGVLAAVGVGASVGVAVGVWHATARNRMMVVIPSG
jgi:NAD(P)H-hydrate repair Nnr-like enzyme with NAD(P)H-hydrate epimerase domain